MTTPTTYPLAAAAIVDQAFILMEKSPPSSFGDDSPEAQDAARHYPEALAACLEDGDWSFVSTFVQLSEADRPAGLTPDPRLPHVYALPGDLVRAREVGDRCTEWRIDGIYLRADATGPLALRYTRKLTNEQQASAKFRMAVATELAARLAPRWLGTATKVEALVTLAGRKLNEAKSDDRVSGSQRTWHGGGGALWSAGIAR